MTKIAEQYKVETIQKYLMDSNAPHLADCLELVDTRIKEAIYDFIRDRRSAQVSRPTIANMVADDVATCVEGEPWNANNCKSFIR